MEKIKTNVKKLVAYKVHKKKNDEYYTLISDIEKEMEEVLKYDKSFFTNKKILLPCDDYSSSKFVEYFKNNFDKFNLKQIISCDINGNYFIKNRVGETKGQSDNAKGFNSKMVNEFKNDSDIIITNPPFSIISDFYEWIDKKDFIIISPLLFFKAKIIVNDFLNKKVHIGKNKPSKFIQPDGTIKGIGGVIWLSNINYFTNNNFLELKTMEENIKNATEPKMKERGYQKYRNYDAIDVPFTKYIPINYDGEMGVPITFLNHYNPEQFEIINISCSTLALKFKLYYQDGKEPFVRVIIKRK